MATAPTRTYTPDDLLRITDRPPPDLVHGQLVERAPMGQESSEIAGTILALLYAYTKANLPVSITGPDGGYRIFANLYPDDPNRVRFPAVALTRRDRLPGGKAARGRSTIVPDLVVEVVSPNDDAEELLAKVEDYRKAGVPMIWIVSPHSRNVQVLHHDGTGRHLSADEMIDGGDVLPGFRCRVAEFFP